MTKRNTRYPGHRNYVGPQSGFFLMLHHDEDIEYSSGVAERVNYIETIKPKNEIKTRKKAITYVRPSELPKRLAKNLVKLQTLEKELKHQDKLIADMSKVLDKLWTKRRRLDRNIEEINFFTGTIDDQERKDVVDLMDKLGVGQFWDPSRRIMLLPY